MVWITGDDGERKCDSEHTSTHWTELQTHCNSARVWNSIIYTSIMFFNNKICEYCAKFFKLFKKIKQFVPCWRLCFNSFPKARIDTWETFRKRIDSSTRMFKISPDFGPDTLFQLSRVQIFMRRTFPLSLGLSLCDHGVCSMRVNNKCVCLCRIGLLKWYLGIRKAQILSVWMLWTTSR